MYMHDMHMHPKTGTCAKDIMKVTPEIRLVSKGRRAHVSYA